MNKDKISKNQEIYTLILFLLGSSFVFGTGSKARQDGWLSILFAVLLFLPMIFVYVRICCLYPGKSLFDIALDVFGNALGRFVVVIYIFYSLYLGALVMRDFSEFINLTSLHETPQIFILSAILIACGFIVKKREKAFARLNVLIFLIIVCITCLVLLLSLSQCNFNLLKPVGGTGVKSIADNAFSVFSFPFAESIVVLSLYGSVDITGHPYRLFIKGALAATAFFLVSDIIVVCVLGPPTLDSTNFPPYEETTLLSVGAFFSRFEVLIGIAILLCGVVKISVCLFASTIGISKLFLIKNREALSYPVGLLMVTLAVTIYKNTGEMLAWLADYKYYAFPFQVIFPLAIWITCEIKRIKKIRRGAEVRPS